MIQFELLDFLIVSVFALLVLALGVFTKLRENTFVQMVVAGRSLTLPVYVATFVSAWYGGALGSGECVSFFGVGGWAFYCMPFYIFTFLFAIFLAKRIREAPQIGMPERLKECFGPKVSRLASGLVYLMSLPAAYLLMTSMMVQLFTGWSLAMSLLIATAIITLFVIRGGMFFDARVSMLACLLILVGFVATIVLCFKQQSLLEMYHSLKPEHRHFDCGFGLAGLVSFLVFAFYCLVEPTFHQKAASTVNSNVSRNGLFVVLAIWIVFDIITVTIGLYGLTLLKEPVSNPLMLIPMVGYKVLPLGLRAIFLCGILAAVFTASVNYLLVAGATLGREISQWVGRGQSALNDMKWSRLGILLSAALAAVLALVVPSVIDLWYAWSGCSIGALLFPVLLSYSRRRYVYHRTSILVGMLGGYLISVGWFLYSKYSGNLLYPIKIADGQTWMMGTTLPGVLGFLTFGGVSHYFLKSKKAGTASLDFEKIEGEDVREEPRVLEELTLSS